MDLLKCNSNSDVKSKIPEHITVYSDKSMYKCTICDKAFKSRTNCIYHKSCANSKEKPFICSICNCSFSVRSHYSYHNLMHSGLNPFKCTKCDKSFKTKNKLQRHQEIHLEKRIIHYCEICSRPFLTKTSVKVHMKIHTGEKSYQCSYCSKAFIEKKNLVNHITSHTGTRDWICEICGKAYPIKWNLELHKRTHTRLRPFCCPVNECRQTFLQNRYLKRHMETHKCLKKYICSFCEKIFSRKDNLQRHIINSHLENQISDSSRAMKILKLQKEIPTVVKYISSTSKECRKNNHNSVSFNSNISFSRTESVIKSVTKTQEIVSFHMNEIEKVSPKKIQSHNR